ncbi:SRPBCC family protein [uncultured Pontibacter sp.]|uniref:SRPBCC family protein n=1 Tax=uncultured Pontibacter sp. TaxID=453356 RepID=UPI002634FE49|nr:SRPBCC family protein [uncultured Pontibacter sp.]
MDTYNQNMSKALHTDYIMPPASGSSHINVGKAERIASVVGGAVLTYLGMRKHGAGALAIAAAGGAMLYRGLTGYCPVNDAAGRDSAGHKDVSVEITRSLTILKPREEVYQFWRQLENLPKFMHHLNDVRQLGPKRSHWSAKVPKGIGTIEWEADIVQEEPNQVLAWRSVADSTVDNAGEVRFMDAVGGKGTVLQATISYRPPAGDVGGTIAHLLNPVFKQMVLNDLHRFKQLMEAGEVATVEGQPSGRS